MYSSNGGTSWTNVALTPATGGAYGPVAVMPGASGVAVMGNNRGTLLATGNFGQSWSKNSVEPIWPVGGLSFPDSNHGWAVGTGYAGSGGEIIETPDAGATWYTQSNAGANWTSQPLNGVYFTDDNNGFAVGGNGTVLNTTNGGTAWSTISTATLPNYRFSWTFHRAYMPTSTSLIASDEWGDIAKYSGGVWTDVSSSPSPQGQFNKIQAVGRKVAFAVGGQLFNSTVDGGQTWNVTQIAGTSNLQGLYFINSTTGWVVDTTASVFKTTNGGSTFTTQSPGGAALYGVYFANSTNGWVVDGAGAVWGTVNGGTSWTKQFTATGIALNSVHGSDANHVWVAGNSGTILYTSNGGASWSTQTSGTAQNLLSLHFVNSTTGWAVGNNGTILYTADGGTGSGGGWTSQNSGVTSVLRDVFAYDTNHVWIAGNFISLVTQNGGTSGSWNELTPPISNWDSLYLWGVSCGDLRSCWMVGAGNLGGIPSILHSYTGGQNP